MKDLIYDALTPLVSVVMPAYNAEPYIEAAVRSVMGQTIRNWELILLDDASQDGTWAVAQSLAAEDDRITVLRNAENMGVARTRNRGIAMCAGRYVALLDSDDVWYPHKLETQLRRMKETNAELSYTSYAIVGADGKKVKGDYLVPDAVSFDSLLKENVIGCSTVLISAKIAKENPFSVDFYHEDYVLWLQLLRGNCPAVGCTEVLTDWRYIENSRSFDKRKAVKNRWQIYRKHLRLSVPQSLWLLANYGINGLKKYLRTIG